MNDIKTILWKGLTPEQRNAIVHEKVLGQDLNKQCDLDSHSDMELRIYDSGDAFCPLCHVYEHINSFEHGIIPPPDYATDIKAAWLIVDFLLKDAYEVNIEMINVPIVMHNVIIFDHKHGGERYSMFTEDIPAAICIAALRAKGYEVVTE